MEHKEQIDVSGNLEIYKVYEDGTEEKIFDDHNIITSGMGIGLALLYAGSGANNITNFQIRYFQLGVGGDTKLTTYGVSETSLVSALGQVDGASDYQSGAQSNLPLATHNLMSWNGGNIPTVGGSFGNDWFFGLISDNSIKRVDLNSITYIIYVARDACNLQTINEIGLFMKNPMGTSTYNSPLVAYRPFFGIAKTDDFALVFKWTLNF